MKHMVYFTALFCAMLFCGSIAQARSIKIETAEFAYLSNQQKEELQRKLREIGLIEPQDKLEFVGRPPRRFLEDETKIVISASAGPMVCRELLGQLEVAFCKNKDDKVNCLAKVKQDYAPRYLECSTIKLSSNQLK
ncbi:MAG: hypothetical protein WBX25_23315 [Rhodomicrobium sp.]